MFDQIANRVSATGILSVDLETTDKVPREAEILLVAMASGESKDIHSVAVRPTPEAIGFLKQNLLNPKIRVVGHNIMNFDLQVLHHRGILALGDAKARIVDTLPMSFLYNENIDHGLKGMVKKILGVKMTTFREAFIMSPALNEMKALEKQITKIEKDLDSTIISSFRKERSQAKKDLVDQIKEAFKGRRKRVDHAEKKRLLARMVAALEERYGEAAMAAARQRAIDTTIADLKARKEFLTNEAFKDQVKYAEDDAKRTLQLYYRLRNILYERGLSQWGQLELEVKMVSSWMELNGIRIDLEQLEKTRAILEDLVEKYLAKTFNLAKTEFNPRSPKQVDDLLYNRFGFKPPDDVRSTDEKTLSRIPHPLPQAILDYRAAHKLLSTYVLRIEKEVKSDSNQRLHGRINTTGPVTGRASSSDPNLQNIPSRKKPNYYDEAIQGVGPTIRRAFVASPGHKLICADLSQIELRLIAHYTGDPTLLAIYNETAAWEGMTYYTGDVHENTRRFVSEIVGYDIGRKLAKNLNFGLCYGMFPRKFAIYARLFRKGTYEYDVEEAAKFRDSFFQVYSSILEEIETLHRDRNSQRDFRKKLLRISTLSGRTRYFPAAMEVNGGKIFNARIQGSAADWLKVSMWSIDKYIVRNPEAGVPGLKMLSQIHDEILMEVPEVYAQRAAILTKFAMEQPWFTIAVPVLASVKICDRWDEKDDDNVHEVGVMPPAESGIKPAVAMLNQATLNTCAKIVPMRSFDPRENGGFVPYTEVQDD